MQTISEIEKLLSLSSSLPDKARGLRLAEKFDAREINEALVAMLNDEASGGRISQDEGMEKPWIEAMHLLARRFPEAGIKVNIDYRYTSKDKSAFKEWWSENKERIAYADNTHSFASNAASDTKQTEPAPPLFLPKVAKESASTPMPTPEAKTQTVSVPTQQPKPAVTPTPAATAETKSTRGFPIVPVAILAAGIVGIVIFILRRKST